MNVPNIPLGERYRSLGISLITIIWWVAIWGLSDTIIHTFFKGQRLAELILYFVMIAFVLTMIFLFPEISKSL